MKTTKQVTIIARYAHKTNGQLNGTVTYLVRSSDSKSEYCTTLVDGKATGCSCPARNGKCYHRSQLECKEAGRPFASKSLPVWTLWLVESGVLVAPKHVVEMPAQEIVPPIAMELPAELRGHKKTAISTDTSVLNGAQQSAGLLMALPSRKARAS